MKWILAINKRESRTGIEEKQISAGRQGATLSVHQWTFVAHQGEELGDRLFHTTGNQIA